MVQDLINGVPMDQPTPLTGIHTSVIIIILALLGEVQHMEILHMDTLTQTLELLIGHIHIMVDMAVDIVGVLETKVDSEFKKNWLVNRGWKAW